MLFAASPPMLVSDRLGRAAVFQGVDVREVSRGEAGHVLYGPYAVVTNGVFQVEFSLALGAEAVKGDPVCAVLDIALDGGRTIIAEHRLHASDLGSDLRTFTLTFPIRHPAHLEYRVASTGEAPLRIAVQPELTRLSGVLDRRPDQRLASTLEELVALADDTRRLLRPLGPHDLVGTGKVRMGSPADGGYVCVDDFEGVDTAFSFGINDDISWDLDAAARGLTVYQFDHTVADPAPDDSRMVFEPKRITAEPSPGSESLSALIRRHDKGRTRPNLILKMDIENSEWEVIEATPEEDLRRLAWITCEMHYFQGLAEPEHRARVDRCLQKLARHFVTVHVHANVWGGLTSLANVIFPNVLEATFANREVYRTGLETGALPGPLDRSCAPGHPDLFLGGFQF
jgi:hypothetical protein